MSVASETVPPLQVAAASVHLGPRVAVLVPCYNEEARLQGEAFLAFLDRPGVHLLFVNDGSSDGTLTLLQGLSDALGERAAVLDLERNGGKAEAVRQGLLRALADPRRRLFR